MSEMVLNEAMITYRRIDEDAYEATSAGRTITVRRVWERVGGWQWAVVEVADGRWHVRGATRKAAAERAFRRLANA